MDAIKRKQGRQTCTMEKINLSELMPLKYIREVVGSIGISSFGTKRQLIDRYELSFDVQRKKTCTKPGLSQLRSMCNLYTRNRRNSHTKDQFLEVLQANNVEWDYLPPYSNSKTMNNAVVHSQNGIPNAVGIRCEECGSLFKTEVTLHVHRLGGHITKEGKLMVKPGRCGNDKFQLGMYDEILDATKKLFQLAYIPWFSVDEDGEEILENVSVGMTSLANVTMYARSIWKQIEAAIGNDDVYLHACGSGRRVAVRLNWFMKPELAKSLNIFFLTAVVGSKVKGFVRELVDSVHVLSASDDFGHLADCHVHIVEVIKEAVVGMADRNVSAFVDNVTQSNQQSKDVRKLRHYLVDASNVLNGIV